MNRKIIHIDMDAYFAAVEQRDYPLFKGRPLFICHTDDTGSNRGIVATASYEARSFGIKAGISVLEARRKCPDGIFIRGNYDKYLYSSKLLKDICYRFSDCVEVYSIDEIFLDVSLLSFSKAVATAERLHNAIFKELGLTCSVGLGPNKLVAKMASELHKPNGLSVVMPEDWPLIFYPMPVKELVGVGRRVQSHLNRMGVSTIGQLASLKGGCLRKKFGVSGLWLQMAARGEDPAPVIRHGSIAVKSFGHSSALGPGTSDKEVILKILLALCEGVGFRMRKENFLTKTIMLRFGLGRLFYYTRSLTLSQATGSTRTIYSKAAKLFKKEGELISSYPCTLIGISACNLKPASQGTQLSLLGADKDSSACHAMDKVKLKYGEESLMRASLLGFKQRYKGVARVEVTKINRGHSAFCSHWLKD